MATEYNVNETPAGLGYSMPAEWEPHEATWLGWPHNPTDWPGKLDTIRWVYGEIVRKLAAVGLGGAMAFGLINLLTALFPSLVSAIQ